MVVNDVKTLCVCVCVCLCVSVFVHILTMYYLYVLNNKCMHEYHQNILPSHLNDVFMMFIATLLKVFGRNIAFTGHSFV